MKTKRAHFVIAPVVGCLVTLAVQHVRASLPTTTTLTYSGFLELPDGTPVDGIKPIAISAYDAKSKRLLECEVPGAPVNVAHGRFQLSLPPACASAIQANPDLSLDVQVDGLSLGRTTLGVVPFALEAQHASTSDSSLNAGLAARATSADSALVASSASSASGALSASIAALQAKAISVSEWQAYTPTVTTSGGGTVTQSSTAFWRRVGDTVEINIVTAFTACTGTGVLRWSYPPGIALDVNKRKQEGMLGWGSAYGGTTVHTLTIPGQGTSAFLVPDREGDPGGGLNCSGAGNLIRLALSFPVVGWSLTN